MKLYSYYQSSASYRVRIALNLKGIATEMEAINLVTGAQRSSDYAAVNPQMQVPSLQVGSDVLTQSLAIMEYLDEVHPEPPILPKDALGRAHTRAIAHAIAADMAPINNLKVRKYLSGTLNADEATVKAWVQHWIAEGFAGLEALLARSPHTRIYCVGDLPTIADCCLVPQMFNARRFDVDLSPYPTIRRISAQCEANPAFAAAHPLKQPDAPAA